MLCVLIPFLEYISIHIFLNTKPMINGDDDHVIYKEKYNLLFDVNCTYS